MPAGTGRIPEDPASRDAQKLRRQGRTYGVVDRDPSDPIEGWSWVRSDLDPPELRVRVGEQVYFVTLQSTVGGEGGEEPASPSSDPTHVHYNGTRRDTSGAGETLLERVTIPGGKLGASGGLLLEIQFEFSGGNDTKQIIVRFGGTTVFNETFGAGTTGDLWVTMYLRNNDVQISQRTWTRLMLETGDYINIVRGVSIVDTKQAQHLEVAGNVANAGDTVSLRMSHVRLVGGAVV